MTDNNVIKCGNIVPIIILIFKNVADLNKQ